MTPYRKQDTVMQALTEDSRFGEFVTALILTGLAEELRERAGTYTVFAPTDEAFANAPQDLMRRVLNDKEEVKSK